MVHIGLFVTKSQGDPLGPDFVCKIKVSRMVSNQIEWNDDV